MPGKTTFPGEIGSITTPNISETEFELIGIYSFFENNADQHINWEDYFNI